MTPLELEASGLPGTSIDPLYPDSDGRPMGETDFHNHAQTLLRECLQDCFAGQSNVYVATNLLFYYEQGNSRARRDPDVLVARGVRGNHFRRSFRLWEEGVVPCTLFEISSKKTWRTDVNAKRTLYAQINVPEYFVFDPENCFLDPQLRGFRLVNGASVEMVPAADGSLISEQLGLRMVPEGNMLRLIELRTGLPILTRSEQVELLRRRAEGEHRRAEDERRRIQEMAAELERLREQLRRQTPP
jgi:Uma2 family endonuclease